MGYSKAPEKPECWQTPFSTLVVNVNEWENKFLGPNFAKNTDYMKKMRQTKVVEN